MLKPRARGNELAVARLPADPDSSPNAEAAGRYAVPRYHAEVPSALVEKFAAEQAERIRDLFRDEFHDTVDVCLAVDAEAAGALFGLSLRAWRRLDVTGQVPRPIRIGR